jgi:hypothetical protein
MAFKKGQSGNPNGRPRGIVSPQTSRFKAAVNHLLEESADSMIKWLEQIEDPKDRFDILHKFGEYVIPKLARTDMSVSGPDGEPVSIMVGFQDGPRVEPDKHNPPA